MPIYAYACASCGNSFEIMQRMSDSAPMQGPGCTKNNCCLEKQLSTVVGIVKSANPFVSKSGKPHCENALSAPVKPVETSHQCQTGCAMHSRS